MAVIAPTGIVGRVVGSPAAHAARVQLIIDRHAAAGALSERARAGGIVVGQDEPGKAPLRMELVSNLADLKVDDMIVTSGAEGIYPKGFAIGRVASVEKGKGLYLAVTVRPLVEFRSLEEVLVVLMPARRRVSAAAVRRRGRRDENSGRNPGSGRGAGAADDARGTDDWRRDRRQPGACRRRVRRARVYGPVPGLLAGSAGGIIQDALAGGVIGIGGLSKTIVGFAVGVLGAQFIVSQPLPRFVMFVGATLVHELCFQALYALVESRAFSLRWTAVLTQAVVNGLVGIIAFRIVEMGPGLLQRRRDRDASITRRRFGLTERDRLTTNDTD